MKKAEVLHQPKKRSPHIAPNIHIDGHPLNMVLVEQFTYLGSIITNDVTSAKDVENRMSKAGSAFGCLQKRVWQNHSLRFPTKILVYKAVVINTLLCGVNTWVLYRKQIKLLEQFHRRCLCSIMNIRWKDYRINNAVFENANLPSMKATLMLRQLRLSGHVSRTPDTRIPKAIFYGELSERERDRRVPRKRWKN